MPDAGPAPAARPAGDQNRNSRSPAPGPAPGCLRRPRELVSTRRFFVTSAACASTRSVLESRLARSGLCSLGAEHETLRILAHGVENAVERARVAIELLDQRVQARQGFVVEGGRRPAYFLEAPRQPGSAPGTVFQV